MCRFATHYAVAPFRSKSAPLFSNFRDLAPPNIVNYIVFSNYDLYRKMNFAHLFLFDREDALAVQGITMMAGKNLVSKSAVYLL